MIHTYSSINLQFRWRLVQTRHDCLKCIICQVLDIVQRPVEGWRWCTQCRHYVLHCCRTRWRLRRCECWSQERLLPPAQAVSVGELDFLAVNSETSYWWHNPVVFTSNSTFIWKNRNLVRSWTNKDISQDDVKFPCQCLSYYACDGRMSYRVPQYSPWKKLLNNPS